ncbi:MULTISPECIES: sensor domain-containing diguanylate cyclase [Nostocales]|uniref:Diguanylate cyclase n=3 Tax=Nostocales TaxID=1161 RepID=A0A8S9TEX8_9CYAN|nr:diguanylate cyclase [Tolypothrix bouteillei]KAF3890182.1 diguanylate cyclase [Tolypothrix bouteillei VB521301]
MIAVLSISPEHCYSQNPELLLLELISNVVLVLAVNSIALALMYFVCKRKELPDAQIFLLFGVLLIGCGISHIIEIWMLWYKQYWLLGGIDALAACIVLYAAIRLPRVISQALGDRKRLEQALQESEAKLNDILNRARAAICCHRVFSNKDWEYEYCSAGTEAVLGYTVGEITADKNLWSSTIHPDDWETIIAPLYEDIFAECSRNIEYRIRHKDGSVRWILGIFCSRRDDVADCWMVTSVCVDITSLKQAQITLQQQAEREHLVSQLTQRIRQSLSIEEVLNTGVAEVRQLLQADRALVYQVMADGTGTVISEAVAKDIPLITGQPLPEEIFPQENYQLYYEGRVQTIADIERDEIAPCLAETLRQLGVRSKIVIPILGQDRLWGLLIAHQCQNPRYWQQWEVDLLKQISEQLAIAIHQADLYRQIQTDLAERQQTELALRRALEREQHAIHRERLIGIIAQNIRQFLHLDSILTTTVEEVRQFLQVDRVVIYQFDAEWHGTVIAESISDPSFSILGQNVQDPCFQKTISHSYFQGRIHAVNDILKANLDPCYVNLLTTLQARAVLVLPVVIHQNLWGLLIAHHCDMPYQWQQATWHLLRQLSTQLAIAIQQSELYQQLEEANRELQRLAKLDGLTQIANRRSFDECLEREWQRSNREQSPLSLLLCDIDHFKLYNDYYGHQAGDNCLQQFAQTLDKVVKRPTDLVARYGGEEFAILLPNTDTMGAIQIVEQIQQAVAQLQIPHLRSGVSQCVTVSIGIACLNPAQELLPEDLIAIADQALYEAKANGRNGYKVGSS